MKPVRYLIAFTLNLLLLSGAASTARADSWPIKDFRVFLENPETGVEYPGLISDGIKSDIEDWLGRVARDYEAQGFRRPHYTYIDDNPFYSEKAFKVYVYPFSGGTQAAMVHPCAESFSNLTNEKTSFYTDTYMKIDPGRTIAGGKLTGQAYQDLAHELFHAVQNAYPMFRADCAALPGGWISEGTAEAVGIETARKLGAATPNHVCQMGVRRYVERLYVKSATGPVVPACAPAKKPYQTQSFWQSLGEYITRLHVKKQLDPEEFVAPDFRYLHKFFSLTYPMGSQSKEYAWLDKALQTAKRYGKHQFGITFQTAYSRFAGVFSSYWKDKRRNLYPGQVSGSDAVKEKRWNELIYGTCAPVLVEKAKPVPPVTIAVESVAARCIKVDFNFPERVKLTFYATDEFQDMALESLSVSTDGGEKIIRRHPAEQVPEKLGYVVVAPRPGRSQYFIVSNVAKEASKTLILNPTIRIVPEISASSVTKAKKKDDGGEDSNPVGELENALESLSWTGQLLQKHVQPCTGQSFDDRPCGPVTVLHLDLESDAGKILREGVQPGISFGRTFDVLGAVEKKGGWQVVDQMIGQQLEIQRRDGASVSIVIPQVSSGYTGTVANAHMRVSKAVNPDGSDNGSFHAIGPEWAGDCPDGFHPSSGRVTIEEFSSRGMRGALSAQLVDSEQRKACQIAPIARSIDGTFTITEIDWGQNLPAPVVTDDELIDRTVEDLNEFHPGLISTELKELAKEKARENRARQSQEKEQKKAKSGDVMFKQCDCRCD